MNAAYCILTKDHPEVMKEISLNFYAPLTAKGFDIYIYDSSEDNRTEQLIKAWNQAGYKNIYYVDSRFTKTGDEKLVAIYMGYGLQKEYDYIWNAKDRTMFSSNFLEKVVNDMQESPDIILAGREDDSYFYSKPKFEDEYTDPVKFFKDFGATTTSWDAVIINRNTMLKDIDWDAYEKTYKVGYSNPFNQTTVIFARLAELDKAKVLIERPEEYDRLCSTLSGSSWAASTVDLWGVRWVSAINRLPSIYDDYKKHVIKVETMHKNVFGSHEQLMGLASKNYLNKDNFSSIRDYFFELSDVPVEYVDMIVEGKINEVAQLLWNDYNRFYEQKDIANIIWYHNANTWFKNELGKETYDNILKYLYEYMQEEDIKIKETYFESINSLDDAIKKINAYFKK